MREVPQGNAFAQKYYLLSPACGVAIADLRAAGNKGP